MRIRVAYDTTYAYAAAARSVIQVLRLTPREHAGQRVPNWRVQVEADGRLRRAEDAFGNVVHTFTLAKPVDRLTVTVAGEVVTADTAGVVQGAPETFPPEVFLRQTALTAPDAAIAAFADGVAAGAGGRLELLHRLMRAIRTRVSFDIGRTDTGTTAADAFAGRQGVCQDLSHIMLACARRLHVPARYVSGHLVRDDGTVEQEAGHAWVEAFVEDLGWVGFDPTNGVSPTDAYLRVATALDYLGAAPVRGSRTGGGAEAMDVRLRVSGRQQ